MPTKKTKRLRGGSLDKLNDKQRLFIALYLADPKMNGTHCCELLGYAHPSKASHSLLNNRHVRQEISKQQTLRLERLELVQDDIVRELSTLAYRDILDLCDDKGKIIVNDMREIPPHVRRCVDGVKQKIRRGEFNGEPFEEVEIELKLVPKSKAIELLMRHFGMLDADNKNVDVNVNLIAELRDRMKTSSNVIDAKMIEADLDTE